MKYYELTYLAASDLSETESKSIQEKITASIQEGGGVVVETRLPVKKDRVYLTVLDFQSEAEKLPFIEKKLREVKGIVRYMLLNKPPRKAMPKRRVPHSVTPAQEETSSVTAKPKVELGEIDHKLDEILDNI